MQWCAAGNLMVLLCDGRSQTAMFPPTGAAGRSVEMVVYNVSGGH